MRFVCRVVKVHRYPRAVTDILLVRLLVLSLHRKGLRIHDHVSFAGLPIITLAPDSRILISEGCRLISRSQTTALGVAHPIILRTLRRGAEIQLGRGVRASGLTVCAGRRVRIGDRCVIGSNTTITDTDFHSLDPVVRAGPQDATSAECRPVEIGADVFIGAGSYILKGVTIEAEAVIGAGSVVTRNVGRGMVVAGNPAIPRGTIELTKSRLTRVPFGS